MEEIKVKIEDKLLCDFTRDARNEVERQANKFTNHIVEEALVIESTRREDDDDKAEITASDVKSAAKRRYSPKKKKWTFAVQAITPIAIFFIGKYWDTEMKDLCIVILVTVAVLHFYALMTNHNG